MLTKLFSKTKTPKFDRYLRLKSEFEASQGDPVAASAAYSDEVQSGLAMAKQQWVKSPSIDTARALHERMVQSESLSKLNLTFMAVEHRTNAVNAFNRANLPLVREALVERGEILVETINKIRGDVAQYYHSQADADAHEPLASLHSRLKEIYQILAETQNVVHPTSAYIDSWISALERPLVLEESPAQSAPKTSLGVFESYNEQMKTMPTFVPERTHAESVAESEKAYLPADDALLEGEMIMVNGGLVRRRRPQPPIYLEPIIEDGVLVGMGKSEHQPA